MRGSRSGSGGSDAKAPSHSKPLDQQAAERRREDDREAFENGLYGESDDALPSAQLRPSSPSLRIQLAFIWQLYQIHGSC
jgi:hypothetical protein